MQWDGKTIFVDPVGGGFPNPETGDRRLTGWHATFYRGCMKRSMSFCIFRKSGGLRYIMCPDSYSA